MSATVSTAKSVNLRQLADALGGAALSLRPAPEGVEVEAHDATTRAQLQAAIDAHVAVDTEGNAATLRQRAAGALANNRDYLALTSPTNAQNVAQVKALTRQMQAVIRLVVGVLDATD